MEDVFIIYIGKRDRKRLFTFTLHFQLAAVVLSVIPNVKHINTRKKPPPPTASEPRSSRQARTSRGPMGPA